MTMHDEMLAELSQVVTALGPYRSDVVFVGGYVPLLYRQSGLFEPPAHAALLSGDIDITVPLELTLRDLSLRGCLDRADYVLVLSRSTEPPVHYFQRREHGDEHLAPFHVEFLAPLTGREIDSGGSHKSPHAVQKGLNAQLLRYLELVLFEPIKITPLGDGAEILVPNPAAYVVQKIHASDRRESAEKRDKDFAYLYDDALLTRSVWPEVAKQLTTLKRAFHEKWFDDASVLARTSFQNTDAMGTRAVVRILRDHDPGAAPSENAVSQLMLRFFDVIDL